MTLTKFEDFAFCITNCDLEAAFFKQILGVKTNLQQLGISELTQLLIEKSNIINSMSRENLLELANHHSILVLDNPSREELLTRIENDMQQRKNILHKFFVFFQHKINCSNFSWVCEFNVDTSSVDKFVNSFESKRWALEDVLNCVKISDLKSFLKELEVVEILDKKWTLIGKIKAAVAKIENEHDITFSLTMFQEFACRIVNSTREADFFKKLLNTQVNLQDVPIERVCLFLERNGDIINSMTKEELLELADIHYMDVGNETSVEDVMKMIETDMKMRKRVIANFFEFFLKNEEIVRIINGVWSQRDVRTFSVDELVESFEETKESLEHMLGLISLPGLKKILDKLPCGNRHFLDSARTLIKKIKASVLKIPKYSFTMFEDLAYCIKNSEKESQLFQNVLNVKTNLKELDYLMLTELLKQNAQIINLMPRDYLLALITEHGISVYKNRAQDQLLMMIEKDMKNRKHDIDHFFKMVENCHPVQDVLQRHFDFETKAELINSFEERRNSLINMFKFIDGPGLEIIWQQIFNTAPSDEDGRVLQKLGFSVLEKTAARGH